jgi:hypothetical protein
VKIQPPVRVTRTYLQTLAGTPDEVFPLLCPVREAEWASGWDPRLVLSRSGFVEFDCVFTTEDSGREAVWIVTEHDSSAHLVEMLKVVPGHTVTRLRISLRPRGPAQSHAEITYSWTALSAEGESFVQGRTEQAWAAFMREWEEELNTFLRATRAAH